MKPTLTRRTAQALAAATVLALAACASVPPPTDQLTRAENAIKRAEEARVADYASPELTSAREKLTAARDAVTREDMVLAARLAEQARVDAEAAAASAMMQQQAALAAQSDAAKAQAEAEKAKAETEELKRQLLDLEAKATDRGMVMTLGDVLFATGKSELKPGAMARLNKLAAFMLKYPDRAVVIEGHTDSTGSAALNMTLSQQRADAVKAYLISQSVPAASVTAIGKSKDVPVADNTTAAGRQQNRRVEVIIANPPMKK